MSRFRCVKQIVSAALIAAAAVASGTAMAQPSRISEILLNPPGSGDTDEYIEFDGTASSTVSSSAGGDRYYIVQLEGECSPNNPGNVDWLVNLSGTFTAGGKFWLSEDSESISGTPQQTYGHDTTENSGGTFVLIKVPTGQPVPAVNDDWDTDADTDFETVADGGDFDTDWVVIDKIGFIAEQDDCCCGKLFADVNFYAGEASESGNITVPGGATLVATNIGTKACRGAINEIEYVGRCLDSPFKWFAANVQEESGGGSNNEYEVIANFGPACVDANGTIPAAANDDVATPAAANWDCTDTACACP